MSESKRTTPERPPLIDEDGEVRELTADDLARFRPVSDFPEIARLLEKHGKLGRPPLPEDEKKQRVTIYLDRDVVERLKEGGKGWQTRANAKLRKALGL